MSEQSLIPEAARAMIGKEWQEVVGQVTERDIRRFACAIDDPNPLYSDAAYARGETDEFVAPTVVAPAQGESLPMADGDAVVFMNFRADRARQLAAAFVDPGFEGFQARRPQLARFVCLTEYDAALPAPVAFAPDNLAHTLGELLAERGLTQLRIAETEKYAHVTFFFSGGREAPYPGEERILVPSPRVATYDRFGPRVVSPNQCAAAGLSWPHDGPPTGDRPRFTGRWWPYPPSTGQRISAVTNITSP